MKTWKCFIWLALLAAVLEISSATSLQKLLEQYTNMYNTYDVSLFFI